MWSLKFWEDWPKQERIILLAFGTIALGAITWLWLVKFEYPSPTIKLATITDARLHDVSIGQFRKGPFDFSSTANNYTITERLLGEPIHVNTTASYILLGLLSVFVIGMMSIVTTLGRFYFSLCMALFFLLVTSLKMELLLMFGLPDKTFSIGVMSAYGLLSFYIFYFRDGMSFVMRMLLFTIVTALVGICVQMFAQVESPFLHIGIHSLEAGMIAAAILIITVSHEIMAAFVYMVSQGTRQGKSLNHFVIISGIYLINLVLAYCIRYNYLRWDIITINLSLLLTISVILGFWGFRLRYRQVEGVVDMEPYGMLGYVLVAILGMGTYAVLYNTANDAGIEALNDLVIFSHLAFGFIFITYMASNFMGMLAKNMQVHKVLYAPMTMPFFTFRLAGLITTLALIIFNTWQVPVHNAVGAYYNNIGDLYMTLGNTPVAREYYNEARTFGFKNHHSNYALATIASESFDIRSERKFYEDASYLRPTNASLLNWAQTYKSEGNSVGSISVLMEALERDPKNPVLLNALGLLYSDANLLDSARLYLEMAASLAGKGSQPEINLAALEAMATKDSIQNFQSPSLPLVTNKLAAANAHHRIDGDVINWPTDTVLSLTQAAYISNYLLNHIAQKDTTAISNAIQLARIGSNSGYKEAIMFAAAHAAYAAGRVREAFTILEEITVTSQVKGKYNNQMTMWAIEQGETTRALSYSDYAVDQGFKQAKLTNAVAMTENLLATDRSKRSELGAVLIAWDSAATLDKQLASNIQFVLTTSNSAVAELNAKDLYTYVRYKAMSSDNAEFDRILSYFTNDDLKARTIIDRAELQFENEEYNKSLETLGKIQGLQLSDLQINIDFLLLQLRLLARQGTGKDLAELMKDKDPSTYGGRMYHQIYFNTLIAQTQGDTVAAKKGFEWLGSANPFFDDGVIAAADYFRGKGQKPYNILVEATQYHPSSVKIRKAYCLEAARQGLDDFALMAYDELANYMKPEDFKGFKLQLDAVMKEGDEDF